MKRRYTFDDAKKGIKGTPVAVDLDDHGTRFWLRTPRTGIQRLIDGPDRSRFASC